MRNATTNPNHAWISAIPVKKSLVYKFYLIFFAIFLRKSKISQTCTISQ